MGCNERMVRCSLKSVTGSRMAPRADSLAAMRASSSTWDYRLSRIGTTLGGGK
jgi:hypothetical protein